MSQRLDSTGRRAREGDLVRVLGIPDLSTMSPATRRETEAVFEHIVGTYRRVVGFTPLGLAELMFRIRGGASAGLHIVEIETDHLRVRRPRRR